MTAHKEDLAVTVWRRLPCGCEIQMRSIEFMSATNTNTLHQNEKDLNRMAETLACWLTDRTARHDCTLVTLDNPSGAKPRAPKELQK